MIYKQGSRGEDVRKIQETLKLLGYSAGQIDSVFGQNTRSAVIAFQLGNELNGDGIVGPQTWKKLFPNTEPHQPELLIPASREELYDLFGDPLDPGYWKAYGGFCKTPSELNHVFAYQWENENGFWCNKLLIPIFSRVYKKIVEQDLSGSLETFDGCYALRYIRGGKELSTHSWGIAVDHNAKTNLLGADGDMSSSVVEIFESEGFYWGGRFKRKDPMHFEFTQSGL